MEKPEEDRQVKMAVLTRDREVPRSRESGRGAAHLPCGSPPPSIRARRHHTFTASPRHFWRQPKSQPKGTRSEPAFVRVQTSGTKRTCSYRKAYHEELAQVNQEGCASQICRVGQLAADPGEQTVQSQSEGRLLQNSPLTSERSVLCSIWAVA